MNLLQWKTEFTDKLRNAGVVEGQTILVHSSFKAMGCPGAPDDVVDALLDAVGKSGTLAVPTHTWGIVNARQPVFDV
ncbi:MAG: AAC(3) family N-acetyltransferase, partial [Armatimonadota bacterium]